MTMYRTVQQSLVRIALLAASFGTLCISSTQATPLNNVYDTQPIHTPLGSDVFFTEKSKGEIRFHISPFYQQTSTARDGEGNKVSGGDRLGQWNMYGVFFGRGANPFGAAGFTALNFPKLQPAQVAIAGLNVDEAPYAAVAPVEYTNEAYFKSEKQKFAYVDVLTNYEKIGLRSQLNFDFGFGLGVAVKGGVVDIKQRMRSFNLTSDFSKDAVDATKPSAVTIYNTLFESVARDAVLSDIALSLKPFHTTAAEDMHISCYWNVPLDLEDKKGETSVVFVPRLAIGMWLPLGEEYDSTKIFSVPTGNNGFYAGTVEASLGLDFPVLPKGHTLQFNVGGGVMLSGEKDKVNQRIHSSLLQVGIIPWRTSVTMRPGTTWHMNASMMADGVVDDFSVYFDFLYTQHLADSITLKTTDAAQKTAFNEGVAQDVRDSSWKNQQINAGFNYKIAECLSLGGAVQAHISGVRVMRTVTLLGGMTFAF